MLSALHVTSNSTCTRKVHISPQTLPSCSERVKGLARETTVYHGRYTMLLFFVFLDYEEHNIVRQIRAEKSESCAILYRSMKFCMVVEDDSKINFRIGATAKFI